MGSASGRSGHATMHGMADRLSPLDVSFLYFEAVSYTHLTLPTTERV